MYDVLGRVNPPKPRLGDPGSACESMGCPQEVLPHSMDVGSSMPLVCGVVVVVGCGCGWFGLGKSQSVYESGELSK